MNTSGRRETEHSITIPCGAESAFRLLADVQQWPNVFPPTIHVERVAGDDRVERIRIWALANGEVKSWLSRRELDSERGRIEFAQEVSPTPIASMAGAWVVEAAPDGGSRIRLTHQFEATAAEHLAWIERTVDCNSRAELDALRGRAAAIQLGDELTFSFEDVVQAQGKAKDIFEFLADAKQWPERLPHVSRVRLDTDANGVQVLEMDTSTPHGATHTTKSYRVLLPHQGIAYKQVTLPSLLSVHTGFWTVTQTDHGVAVSSRHTVSLNPDNIAMVLGEHATIADAREHVQEALSTNSRATLECAKRHAEQAPG